MVACLRVALCQIATHDTAYLLDMPALWTPQTKDVIKYFFSQLLQSEEILKLGQDTFEMPIFTLEFIDPCSVNSYKPIFITQLIKFR